MKKSLLALAALATVAGAASAQSSVTLSGSVDLGVKHEGVDLRDPVTGAITGSDSNWSLGGAASSRTAITLSGVEDLGGGLKAFFLANHRFNANDGTVNSGIGFWRQSWVGLSGGFGDVRLGKMLPPLQEFNGQYEPWDGGDTVANVHTGGIASGFTNARYNGAAYYRSPSFGGAQLHAMVADSNQNGGGAGVANGETPVGVGVQFVNGPLSLALAGDRTATDVKTLGAYGKYNFGVATLLAQFERGNLVADDDKVARWSIGGLIPIGAAVIKVGYLKASDEEFSKIGLGADYWLSKRTRLYTDVGKIRGDGPTDGAKKTKFDLGVQHKF
jgi:predicted porin